MGSHGDEIGRYFSNALSAVISSPQLRFCDLDLLGDHARARIMSLNGDTPEQISQCIHQMVDDRATKQPHLSAISAWDGELTYGELSTLSSQLAYHLCDIGVGPGMIVPLLFEKSKWMIISILAVLKAGAAFAPLAPAQAPDRRERIMQQLEAPIVLTSHKHSTISLKTRRTIVSVGPHSTCFTDSSINSLPGKVQLPKPDPNAPIYVFHTSGSTGQPKGVILEHKAITSSCYYHGLEVGYLEGARVLQFASYTFDASMMEILTSLLFGSTVVIPSEEDLHDRLNEVMRDSSIEMAFVTPSVARLIDLSYCFRLRVILLAGEASTTEDFARWTGKRILQGYGPTEAGILCAVAEIDPGKDNPRNIGHPVGCRFWVVDPNDHEKLVPLGSTGELLIEGSLLAKGYLNQPDATAAAFISPSWLSQSRLYKTGDLVTRRQDGSFMFVGRKDSQVKIRGQRIELGEIEHHVKSCFVTAQQVVVEIITLSDKSAVPQLAVFITYADKSQNRGSYPQILLVGPDVEEKLEQMLPSYMIPTIFFTVDHLPLMVSGKSDRRALREIGHQFSSSQLASFQSKDQSLKRTPENEHERILLEIWARVLNLEIDLIGTDDSFFRLGGDSITAMQVASSARDRGLKISSAQVLREKTVTRIVSAQVTARSQQSAVVAEIAAGQSFPLSPIQRLYFRLQEDPVVSFDQCFFLKFHQQKQYQEIVQGLETLVSGHAILRARFKKSEAGGWGQTFTDDIHRSLHTRFVDHARPEQVSSLIAEARDSLDIMEGPLVSAVFMTDVEGPEQRLFITIHHLVVDLISWRALLAQLEEILTYTTPTFMPSITFPAWSCLQAEYLSTYDSQSLPEPSAPLFSYWGYNGKPSLSSMPNSVEFTLDESTTSALLGNSNDAFRTQPIELMISALLYAFGHTFSDRNLPVVFNETHGRDVWDDSIDISRTIGWFTQTAPIEISQSRGFSLHDIVRQTKDQMRDIPNNSGHCFTSRFAESMPAELVFNYGGLYQQMERQDALFESIPLPDGCAPKSFDRHKRAALFEVLAQVTYGKLSIVLLFDRKANFQDKIRSWANLYEDALVQIGNQFSDMSPKWTLVDFPGIFGSYGDIEHFLQVTLPGLEIEADQVEDLFPCSSIQEGILISQMKDPRSYRTSLEIALSTRNFGTQLDLDRVKDAWKAVVRRHALLRAVIVGDFPGGHAYMHVVLKDPSVHVQIISDEDLATSTAYPGSNQQNEARVDNHLQHKVSIVRRSSTDAHFILEMNHAITDAHSRDIIFHDLQAAFEGVLDPSCASYSNFISYIGEKSYEEGLGHWKSYLAQAEASYFPHLGEGETSGEAKEVVVEVPDINTDAVRRFCAEMEVTPATVIQLAWSLVLSQYTGSSTPTFGVLSSGRDVPVDNVNEIFGPFIGMLPFTLSLATADTVAKVLETSQKDYLRGLSYQAVSLASIHNFLGLGSSALFNSVVTLQKVSSRPPAREAKAIELELISGSDPTEVRQSLPLLFLYYRY